MSHDTAPFHGTAPGRSRPGPSSAAPDPARPADPGHQMLDALGRQWRQRRGLVGGLVALGLWLPWVALLDVVSRPNIRVFVVGALLVTGAVLGGFWRWWRARPSDRLAVATELDRSLVSLEHSGELLAARGSTLGPVARMQRARVQRALAAEPRADAHLPSLSVAAGVRCLALGAAIAVGIWLGLPSVVAAFRSPGPGTASAANGNAVGTVDAAATESPTIDTLVLEIGPPAYTQLPVRRVTVIEAGIAAALEIEVPDGSHVTWRLFVRGSGPLTAEQTAELAAELVWGDRSVVLDADGAGGWQHAEVVTEGRVFLVQLRDPTGERLATSPYIRLAMIEDQPPRVAVVEPPLEVEVSPAEGLDLRIRAEVADDYSVAGTSLIATLALGAGEMVQFREQRFGLDLETRREDGTMVVQRVLDLGTLGLEPGGELYFFLEAWDNYPAAGQRSRSATHVVRWPGGSAGTVSLDSGLPMILPPDTFRSQRQIIIDTERLLAEHGELDDATFARRARTIAQDQQALRLRYGAILGDEFVDGRPVGAGGSNDGHGHPKAHHDDVPGSPAEDHPHDHGRAAENGGLAFGEQRFGDDDTPRTTRLIDLAGELEGDLVHAHDSEESATFFATETKRTLKSSLANMWEAELRLHLAAPDDALPYEYRALRLLKEVQQASRVYVRRVGFGTPPLDPGRRFTGELDDIGTQRPRRESEPRPDRPAVRRALAALDAPRLMAQNEARAGAPAMPEPAGTSTLADLLQTAAAEIAEATGAADSTPVDLALLEVLRGASESLRQGRALPPDQRAEMIAGLWRSLALPAPVPDRSIAAPSALWEHYRAAVDAPARADDERGG